MRKYNYNAIELKIIRYTLLFTAFICSVISNVGVLLSFYKHHSFSIAFPLIIVSLYWIGILLYIHKSKKI